MRFIKINKAVHLKRYRTNLEHLQKDLTEISDESVTISVGETRYFFPRDHRHSFIDDSTMALVTHLLNGVELALHINKRGLQKLGVEDIPQEEDK